MAQAKKGDKVKVHYTGKLQDGTVFDSSKGRDPMSMTLGTGEVIPGFENAVLGMTTGDSKTATIPPDQAYGPRRDEMVLRVKKTQFPENINPEVGQQLQLTQPDGQEVQVRVTEIEGEQVTLDGNHPLAGKDLTFDIELVEVIAA